MAVESHIETLQRKHADLEARLHELHLSPSTSDDTLSSLKRQKLKLKDEIEKLRSTL